MTLKASSIVKQGLTRNGDSFVADGQVLGNGIPAQQFSNWSLVDTIKFNNEAGTKTVNTEGIDRVMLKLRFETPQTVDSLRIRMNGDAGSNYSYNMVWGRDDNTNVDALSDNNINGIPGLGTGFTNDANEGIIIMEGSLEPGMKRMFTGHGTVDNGVLVNIKCAASWSNSVDPVSTIDFMNGVASTYEIEVYKWASSNVVDMASYELVREVTFDGALDETIEWDGDLYDECKIVTTLTNPMTNVYLAVNGDDVTSMYATGTLTHTGNVANGGYTNGTPGMIVGWGLGVAGSMSNSTTTLQLGTGAWKSSQTSCSYFQSNSTSRTAAMTNGIYKSSAKATGLRLHSGGTVIAGTIKVYRLAQAQVVQSGYSLHKRYKFTDEQVDITIDTSTLGDFDELMLTAASTKTVASTDDCLNIEFNGTAPSKAYMYGGAANGGATTVNGIFTSNATTQQTHKMYVSPSGKSATQIGSYIQNGSQYTQQNGLFCIDAEEKINTVRVFAPGSFTGSLSIHKI